MRSEPEAQWHYAASGGDEQRTFPWSAPPAEAAVTQVQAVIDDQSIEGVGSRTTGVGRWAIWDLVETSANGCSTTSAQKKYDTPCVDCVRLVPIEDRSLPIGNRVRRGGDFAANATRARTTYRSAQPAEESNEYTGIRCVCSRSE